MTDFRVLLTALTDAELEFIIVGGAAATAHGASRLTEDLDIVYRRAAENLRHLVAALKDYAPYPRGAPLGLPFCWEERTIANGLNFTLTTTHGDLDILGEITGGGGYEQLLPHTVVLKLFGVECRCLSVSRLIEVKRAAGRPKDYDAIAELEAIQEERDR